MIEGYRVVTEVTGEIDARGASDSGKTLNTERCSDGNRHGMT
jgi:hypothetical protein